MGKVEEEPSLSTHTADEISQEGIVGNRCEFGRFVRLRCLVALVFGAAVLLSAIFWLPPFLRGDRWEEDAQAPIMASFNLQKPVPFLKDNIRRLEGDIIDEIGVLDFMIFVTSLEPLEGPNWTAVTFGVWPYAKNSEISSAALSLLRASFTSFVNRQSTLHLTSSLFGDPSFFQVLKFPGGITVIPQQRAFLLQRMQIFINFTLNYSIYQIQVVFDELKNQLHSGLHLTSRENLYIRLTNIQGSTLVPPTVVQSSVIFYVGNDFLPRLKQLTHDISNSPARNLGLNHTVFGKVKQIQLSSTPNSLNRSNGGRHSGSPAQSPAPVPPVVHRHHHCHHHHLHHHPNVHLPSPLPAPAPAPTHQHIDRSSYRLRSRYRISTKHSHSSTIGPAASPQSSTGHHLHGDPPLFPSPFRMPEPPASSHIPGVLFAHVHPPSRDGVRSNLPVVKKMPVSLPPSASLCGSVLDVHWQQWAFSLLLCAVFYA